MYGVHRSRYLTTRTRTDFVDDCRAVLAQTLLPVEVVATALSSSHDDSQKPVDSAKTSEIPAPNDCAKRRSMLSSRRYSWYRQVPGRKYRVHNLDTRNPEEFKRAVNTMGSLLGRKPQ